MAFVIKALGVGNLDSLSTFDLYTVPASKSALVTSVRLVNAGGNAAMVNLLVRPSGGTARLVAKGGQWIAPSGMTVMEDPVTLGQGDKIQANYVSGTSPWTVHWMISGLERE